jgi:hypothetical protein
MLFAFKDGVAEIIPLANAIENYYHLSPEHHAATG